MYVYSGRKQTSLVVRSLVALNFSKFLLAYFELKNACFSHFMRKDKIRSPYVSVGFHELKIVEIRLTVPE